MLCLRGLRCAVGSSARVLYPLRGLEAEGQASAAARGMLGCLRCAGYGSLPASGPASVNQPSAASEGRDQWREDTETRGNLAAGACVELASCESVPGHRRGGCEGCWGCCEGCWGCCEGCWGCCEGCWGWRLRLSVPYAGGCRAASSGTPSCGVRRGCSLKRGCTLTSVLHSDAAMMWLQEV